MSSVWEDVKREIKPNIPEKSFQLWIDPVTFLENKDDTIVLGCPNKFSRDWIRDNYIGIIEEKLGTLGNTRSKLALEIRPPRKRLVPSDTPRTSKQLTLPHMPIKRRNGRRWLHREYTFDRFVVGQCNEFAYSASKALALGDDRPYNPLFMLADTGLGKSHLTQAIGHAILDQDSSLTVCYITAEDFINEMIFALKNGRIDEFKNKYRRSCDVLLLEEVIFLGARQKHRLNWDIL